SRERAILPPRGALPDAGRAGPWLEYAVAVTGRRRGSSLAVEPPTARAQRQSRSKRKRRILPSVRRLPLGRRQARLPAGGALGKPVGYRGGGKALQKLRAR